MKKGKLKYTVDFNPQKEELVFSFKTKDFPVAEFSTALMEFAKFLLKEEKKPTTFKK